LDEFIGRQRIGQSPELERILDIRLHPHAGRAAGAVTEHDSDRVARPQESRDGADEDGLRPGADVEARIVHGVERDAVRRLDGDVVRRGRLRELRLGHVAGGTPADLDAARVIDAELAGGVGVGQRRV
jgi:hypothetical protein